MKKFGLLLFQIIGLMFAFHSHAVAAYPLAIMVDILQLETDAISQAENAEGKIEALLTRAETYLITGEH